MCVSQAAARTMVASKLLLNFQIRSHGPSVFPRFVSTQHSLQPLRYASFNGHISSRHLRPSLLTPAASSFSGGGRPPTSQTGQTGELPRPPETIPLDPDVANRVCLIGYLSRDVELKHLHTGHTVATSSLAVENISKSATNPYMWFYLEFWGEDMAQIAATHLKKGQCLFVSGRVKLETYLNKDNVEKTVCKVAVNGVKFVEDTLGKGYNSGKNFDADSTWKTFFKNPADWWDYRNNKPSLKYPDFKHKKTGEALWIGNSTPEWVHPELAKLESTTKQGGSIEDLWRSYLDNPADWYDNRKSKPTPKYPDFKHKKSGEALWISSQNTPEWVKEELVELGLGDEGQNGDNEASIVRLWGSFFSDPSEWWDNRKNKKYARAPDFRHKNTAEALWIDHCNNPPWVKSQLSVLDSAIKAGGNEANSAVWSGGKPSASNYKRFTVQDEELEFENSIF